MVKDENIKAYDAVNHPKHYTQGKIECIDFIKDMLTPEEYRGFIKGLIIKYIVRERIKNGDEDLQKARWYLNHYMSELNGEEC